MLVMTMGPSNVFTRNPVPTALSPVIKTRALLWSADSAEVAGLVVGVGVDVGCDPHCMACVAAAVAGKAELGRNPGMPVVPMVPGAVTWSSWMISTSYCVIIVGK